MEHKLGKIAVLGMGKMGGILVRAFQKQALFASSGVGRKVLKHPKVGKLVFEHAVFRPEESPEHRFVIYSAVPVANTPEKLRRLLGDRSPSGR